MMRNNIFFAIGIELKKNKKKFFISIKDLRKIERLYQIYLKISFNTIHKSLWKLME